MKRMQDAIKSFRSSILSSNATNTQKQSKPTGYQPLQDPKLTVLHKSAVVSNQLT